MCVCILSHITYLTVIFHLTAALCAVGHVNCEGNVLFSLCGQAGNSLGPVRGSLCLFCLMPHSTLIYVVWLPNCRNYYARTSRIVPLCLAPPAPLPPFQNGRQREGKGSIMVVMHLHNGLPLPPHTQATSLAHAQSTEVAGTWLHGVAFANSQQPPAAATPTLTSEWKNEHQQTANQRQCQFLATSCGSDSN